MLKFDREACHERVEDKQHQAESYRGHRAIGYQTAAQPAVKSIEPRANAVASEPSTIGNGKVRAVLGSGWPKYGGNLVRVICQESAISTTHSGPGKARHQVVASFR